MTLTTIQRDLLRDTLGLSFYVTKPTRNWLPHSYVDKNPADVAELERLGYLVTRKFAAQGGMETITEITEAGRAALLAATA